MVFRFIANLHGINQVDMVICDENWKQKTIAMDHSIDLWIRELLMNNERVVYRYRINDGMITLNDPEADYYIKDSSMTVWSVKENKNYTKINPVIQQCVITDRVMSCVNNRYIKKQFVSGEIVKIVAGIKVQNVCGIHSISIIWNQPDGKVYHIDERTIESDENAVADVWFWVNQKEMKGEFYKGIWTVEIFIDGRSVIKDNFILSENIRKKYIGFSCIA